jgi:hypothetical protein
VVVGASGLTAYGEAPWDRVEVSAGDRAAQLTEPERYLDMQKDRGRCGWKAHRTSNSTRDPHAKLGDS